MNEVDFTENRRSSRPQEGRNQTIQDSIDGLNSHEFSRVNKLIEEHYDKKQKTIMDKPLGEVINNTANFFNNSFHSFSDKLLEAESVLRLTEDSTSISSILHKYTTAIILFIREDDNIIYLGIIMIILSVLICFFNISRSYGYAKSIEES
jgi:hypothetical protein